MTLEIGIVFGLVLLALVLFAWERFPFDVTALLVLSVLLVTGILTPEEGLAGFSNRATVTIAAMFVLTEGLRRTGFLDRLGELLADAGGGQFFRTLVVLMLTVGVVSAFINNTAAVAIFIPVVIGVSAKMEVSPSKLLIPMSFASMFGGVMTLVGTSTNLLVSSIAEDAGMGAFSMFDFTPVGAAFFVVGFLYVVTLGVRLLPARRSPDDLTSTYGMGDFVTDVRITEGSELAGRTLGESGLVDDLDADVLAVLRHREGEVEVDSPAGQGSPGGVGGSEEEEEAESSSRDGGFRARELGSTLEAGDVLRIRGSAPEIEQLLDRSGVEVRSAREWADADLELGRGKLVEAVVAPDAPVVGTPLRTVDIARRFGAVVLALRRRGEVTNADLGEKRLEGGDSLLLLMEPEREDEIRNDASFVVVSSLGPRRRRDRMWLALAILAAVVSLAALGVAPIVVTAVVGAVALVLTGCIDMQRAYRAIDWKIIFLLAGVLPLGTAMEKTGAAELLADGLLDVLGSLGPHAVLAGFLLVTMALTGIVTNNATAVLLAPVAISAAQSLGVDAWPLLMGVTYAASLSFVTPIGYQTNTLVYGPGGYRFTDYARVGALLNLLFLGLGTWLIPVVFPFAP